MIVTAWEHSDGSVTAKDGVAPPAPDEPGDAPRLLYTLEYPTWEEAMQEHHRRQGREPYRPMED